ncbi:hypothetical protein LTR39_005858, partial [Cryomyces antarcticus]
MRVPDLLPLALCATATALALPQLLDTSNGITAVAGASSSNATTLGNHYNYWAIHANDGVFDLTRSDRLPLTSPRTIPMLGSRKTAVIEPSRSALVVIDMQNFFLHPALSPVATKGRKAVLPTVQMVRGFRKAGTKVLWTNWGLDDFDLLTIPPAFLSGFASHDHPATTFGTDMGLVPGTNVQAGKKLMRGSWNARPWGELYDLQVE